MYNFNPQRPRLGISACVIGEPVRYDGGHKRSDLCTETLAEYLDFEALCPEMAIGMGTPRPTLRLEHRGKDLIARCSDGRDLSAPLREYGSQQGARLTNIAGYIFCAKSPSCGMERVKVYKGDGHDADRVGTGLFAREIMAARPDLPVEENGRLNDPILRENFIARVYVYHRWLSLARQGFKAAGLIDFHSRCKYALMAHSPAAYRRLGRLLSDLSGDGLNGLETIANTYISELMRALALPISRRNHSNVLQHIQGYLRDRLSSPERVELARNIDNYRLGRLPLLAPITLIRHYLAIYPTPYIERQHYLSPYPDALGLRDGL